METYKFNLSSSIFIADPSPIDHQSFTLPSKHGEWICDVHLYTEKMLGTTQVDKLVGRHHSHKLTDNWEKVGEIGVETGMAGMYDSTRVKSLSEEDRDSYYAEAAFMEKNGCVVGQGAGVVCWSGFGDGAYDVFKQVEDGVTVAVQIVFISEKDKELVCKVIRSVL